MPNIKIHRAVIYKDFSGDPGPCPKCGGALEKSNQAYMVITRTGNRLEDSFLISGDFGWYCQSCPAVMLNRPELSKMMGLSKPGWKVGKEFSVVGVLNLDAIPENKRDLPLGAPGVPTPLVKFSNFENDGPAQKTSPSEKVILYLQLASEKVTLLLFKGWVYLQIGKLSFLFNCLSRPKELLCLVTPLSHAKYRLKFKNLWKILTPGCLPKNSIL